MSRVDEPAKPGLHSSSHKNSNPDFAAVTDHYLQYSGLSSYLNHAFYHQ